MKFKSDFEWQLRSPIRYASVRRPPAFSDLILLMLATAIIGLLILSRYGFDAAWPQIHNAIVERLWWDMLGMSICILTLGGAIAMVTCLVCHVIFNEFFDIAFHDIHPRHWWVYFGGHQMVPQRKVKYSSLVAYPRWRVLHIDDQLIFFSRKEAMLFKLSF